MVGDHGAACYCIRSFPGFPYDKHPGPRPIGDDQGATCMNHGGRFTAVLPDHVTVGDHPCCGSNSLGDDTSHWIEKGIGIGDRSRPVEGVGGVVREIGIVEVCGKDADGQAICNPIFAIGKIPDSLIGPIKIIRDGPPR